MIRLLCKGPSYNNVLDNPNKPLRKLTWFIILGLSLITVNKFCEKCHEEEKINYAQIILFARAFFGKNHSEITY